jgi:hypothetical protein
VYYHGGEGNLLTAQGYLEKIGELGFNPGELTCLTLEELKEFVGETVRVPAGALVINGRLMRVIYE